MTEILFLIENDPEGGYTARALGDAIFTQADSMEALRGAVRDAVHCHFDNPKNIPETILLRFQDGRIGSL